MLATGQGLRLLRDLTQHLTTRADDSHAAPVSALPKAPPHLCRVRWMSRAGKVLRVASNKPTCSTACAGPRQFLRVLTLRPYSPGGELIALASTLRGHASQRLVLIVYGVDYQGIKSCLLPTLSQLSVSISPESRLRH